MIPCANSSSASIPLISEARIKRPRAILKSSSRVAVAAGEGCRLVIISRRATPRSLNCGQGRCIQFEGYSGHGEVTVLSDGAEIMKRLPKALPKPTTHIIDWFHLAMKIRPMQQIADHIVGSRPILCGILAVIDEEIKALKWKLWHGQVERAICALEKIIVDMDELGRQGDFSAARLNSLGQQLLTYIRSNRSALVDYGARYRGGRRVSTSLAESAVNSLVAKRMVKNQQMRWSPSGANLMLQVKAAMVNGNLRQRLRHKPNLPALPLHPIFQPTPPLLRAA
jgi:hypothetical protein